MFVARWRVEARFGHKTAAVQLMHQWMEEIGGPAGFAGKSVRLLNGSVGALESTIETEVQVESLAELESVWAKMATVPGHGEWAKKLEPHIVSGTAKWEIFRIL